MAESSVIKTQEDLDRWGKFLAAQPLPMTVAYTKGSKRTNPQNALVHKWFAEIAVHRGDTTATDVKAECNLQFGKDIMMEDEEWASAFGYFFEPLSYQAKLKAIKVFDIPFTRKMTVPQLTGYMDEMAREYRSQGIFLTDPELRGYGETNRD